MKIIRLSGILFIALLLLTSSNILAQAKSKVIPQCVIEAFEKKYPGTQVKSWKTGNDKYIARFILANKKYFTEYDSQGTWIKTTCKIKWTRDLPKIVQTAIRHSKYADWTVDEIKELWDSSGHFFQLFVDDGNLQIDAFHENIFTENWVIDFSTNGEIIRKKRLDNATSKVEN